MSPAKAVVLDAGEESPDGYMGELHEEIEMKVDEDSLRKNRVMGFCTKRMLFCWLVGVIILVLAISLPLALRDTRNNEVSEGAGGEVSFVASDQQISSTKAYQVLQPLVLNLSALLDPTTPQGQAYQMIQDEQDSFYIQQFFALLTIFFSTGGETEWTFSHGWIQPSSSDNPCEWSGVTICRNQGEGHMAVAGLSLDSNNLQGQIPEEICLLTSLEQLDLANNGLTGTLPPCLASLTKLKTLEVQGNPDLDPDAVSYYLFCDDDRSWMTFVTDCSITCPCCTACA